ncbi:vascular endothelial growth factor A-like isoform X1 [Platichthys flesus]|uniref:vascular endothelial growth factor A-like isoform X1 n=1 Tax=Platichthys flesus TaxID=8260 RepID=UPI002DBB369D|nr:vascular endothelial growth factor A-like isoform X1 [Platichthys flesus]
MMEFISPGVPHLVLVLLVQLTVHAQIPPPPDDKAPKGMMFEEVMAKSMCHPMEQLVDVEQEFPGVVGYIYMPACVSLWRCSGCCRDEYLECHPTLERNITVQMIRIAPFISRNHVELTFVEHQKCDCRARQTLLNYTSSSQESFRSKPRRRKLKKTETGCGKRPRTDEIKQYNNMLSAVLLFSLACR